MKLTLNRFSDNGESTTGILAINDKFSCFTIEDTFRSVKIAGSTRIPSGTYEIKLRNEGGMTKRYAQKFKDHVGMLWLQNVPGFNWVYIHIGNTSKATEGCILVGDTCNNNQLKNGFVGSSTVAYRRIYKAIATEILKGNKVTIEIIDL